ncbi:hypothetical protein [Sphingomonas sp. Root710]|uniref:hypothetical protein n=1 Tax=Sphingomonas sp. Root710 TaxID=1736594 RepID=UPI000AC0B3F8|nr:hypothetical protein [Sphingomonas sp. Root710]
MDLNDLLHRHQVSLMRSAAAVCAPSRLAHLGLAKGYARQIDSLQRTLGATPGSLLMRA